MDLSAFKIQFPELDNAGDALISAYLTAAALEVDPEAWGPKTDQGIAFLAAHKLVLSPWGQNAKPQIKDPNDTVYWKEYRRMQTACAVGPRCVIPPGIGLLGGGYYGPWW